MAIAITLKEYLADKHVEYEVIKHAHTDGSIQTAEVAHIPSDKLAKSVMLEDENGRYLLAVIPATYHVDLGKLHRQYDVQIGLATEQELGEIFEDCVTGAIPPVGGAYGIDVVVDENLDDCTDVYFEAGDHEQLVHLSGRSFRELMSPAAHGLFTRRV